MDFRTIVKLPEERLQLTPASKVLLIGSCFTDHIGRYMTDALPRGAVDVNPNGVLYNPGSIFTALNLLLDSSSSLEESSFFEGRDGMWRNWLYAGEFAANTIEGCWNKIQERRLQAMQLLNEANALFITLSTDHCYYLQPDCARTSLVANCHKEPSKRFTEAALPFTEILKEGNALLEQIHQRLPHLKVVFTVSPYRYRKYGLHESQVSKARLMHAIDELCASHDNAIYFPAYEIIIDELRDYRFYNADMLHPSEQAVAYVWERFQEWAFTPELQEYADEKAALIRDFDHRPLHPDSEAARQFFEKREQKREKFIKKWGCL